MPAHHAHHKGQHPRHQLLSADVERQATPFEIALLRASALTPPERDSNTDPAAQALAEFKGGRGNIDHWRALVDAVNVSEALAQRHRIAPDHLATILAGQDALAAVYARQLMSWTLRGTEITALTNALFIWRVQGDFCSRGELAAARGYVQRRSQQVQRSAHNPGARIVGTEA